MNVPFKIDLKLNITNLLVRCCTPIDATSNFRPTLSCSVTRNSAFEPIGNEGRFLLITTKLDKEIRVIDATGFTYNYNKETCCG